MKILCLPKITCQLTVWALVLPSGAYAQSVLERVLSQIDGSTNLAQVNGVYANIAESVLLTNPVENTTPLVIADAEPSDILFFIRNNYGPTRTVTAADIGTTLIVPYSAITLNADGSVSTVDTDGDPTDVWSFFDPSGSQLLFAIQDGNSATIDFSEYRIFDDGTARRITTVAAAAAANYEAAGFSQTFETSVSQEFIFTTIDGSVTNIIEGVTESTKEAIAGAATATEYSIPTINIGDIATTALGAVNTGDITVGVNTAVNEASSSANRAISASLTVVGGSADTGTLMLNVARNTSSIQGNVNNTLIAVNGSVGDVTTTALGAVNTGTITNGVDTVIQGIVGSAGVN